MNKTPDKKWFLLICVMLVIVTFFAFKQVLYNDFVSYDDEVYVTQNPNVYAGLTPKGIIWAFTSPHFYMWHPVTSLSHMLDCQLFGLDPHWHHLTSLIFHIANTLLLFGILRTMTGRLWASAFVAAVFALHPLNVEPVAWVAERKTVLSGFFWMLTIACYVKYVRRRGITNYLLVVLVFAMALMSKPTTVTLPFVLLLLDYWPLNRIGTITLANPSSWRTIFHLVCEKVPLFILSAICSIITFLAQHGGGVVVKLTNLPLHFRLANAVLSYVKYIEKTFWPKDLVAFYSFKGEELTLMWILLPLAFLVVASIRAIKLAPKYRYLPVGWFWFLGALVPVIGIVQAGSQAMADRYAYVPIIGLFVITAWGLDDLIAELRYRKIILSVLALSSLAALTMCTRHQIRYWQNGVTLFEHALQVDKNNSAVHDLFATALARQGKFDEALEHYRIALEMTQNPDPEMLYNIACTYNNIGRYQQAAETFRQAIKTKPNFPQAYTHLGNVYYALGHFTEAVDAYRQAIAIKPDFAEAYNNLGNTLGKLGYPAQAVEACRQAIKIQPDFAEAYCNLGAAYLSQGNLTEAADAFRQAIRLKPDYAQARCNLALTFLQAGDKNSALAQIEILKQLSPDMANALLIRMQK